MKSFAPTISRLVALLAECACWLGGRIVAAECGILPVVAGGRDEAPATDAHATGTESPSVMGGGLRPRKQTWRHTSSPAT